MIVNISWSSHCTVVLFVLVYFFVEHLSILRNECISIKLLIIERKMSCFKGGSIPIN